MGTAMNTAMQTAQYFQHLATEDGTELDEPTLQRLCFYAQGYNLAMTQRPLFDDPIQVCEDGPVIEELRRAHASCGANDASRMAAPDSDVFDFMDGVMLRKIYDNFRTANEADRITAEQADSLLNAWRRGRTGLSFERAMAATFWTAIERSPRTPPSPPLTDEQRNTEFARSKADVEAGRYRRISVER